MLTIRKAGIENINIIYDLAHAIWPVSYKGIITDQQIDYMLGLMYSHEALADQVQKLQQQFIIAYDAETPVGFASYNPKPGDDAGFYRLNKLYLLPLQQGKGSGKFLLNYIIDNIKSAGATGLELNVNKRNPALYFYLKNNFITVREEVIDIGNGFVMDDFVMMRSV